MPAKFEKHLKKYMFCKIGTLVSRDFKKLDNISGRSSGYVVSIDV